MRLRLAALAASLLWTTLTFAGINAVRITSDQEQPVTLLLDQRPVMTFEDNEMLVSTPNVQVRFALTDHPVLTFIEAEQEGLESVKANTPRIELNNQRLIASNLRPGSAIAIYSLDGKRLASATADAQGRATLAVGEAQAYIVRAEGLSFKVMNTGK